jgi:hypothetical protein
MYLNPQWFANEAIPKCQPFCSLIKPLISAEVSSAFVMRQNPFRDGKIYDTEAPKPPSLSKGAAAV